MAPLIKLYNKDHQALVGWLVREYGLKQDVGLGNPHRIRREKIAVRLELYRDKPERALCHVIDEIYQTQKMRDALRPFIQVAKEHNVERRINDKVASLYDRPALRALKSNEDGFRLVEKRMRLHFVHQEAHRLTNLCNEVLVWLFKGIDEAPTLRIITPNLFDAVPDPRNKLVPAGYILDTCAAAPVTDEDRRRQANYEIWDDTYRYLVNAYGSIVDENGDPGQPMEHKLGRIPGVLFHRREPVEEILDASYGEDLKSAHLGIALLEVMIMRLSKTQGENQPVLQGNLASMATGQSMDGESPLALPPEVVASMLSMKTDSGHYLNVQREKITAIAQSRGISYEQYTNSGSSDSGKLYEMQRQELTKIQLEQRGRAKVHEVEVATLIGFPGEELVVDFQEQAVPADAGEEVDLLDKKMRKGLDSPIDFLQRKDPDLTRDDAIDLLKRNLTDYAALILWVCALNVPDGADAENPGATPQENGANNAPKDKRGSTPHAKGGDTQASSDLVAIAKEVLNAAN